jgi:Putative esterase
MALLGTPLIVVLALAAVLVPVATVLVWSRLGGPALLRNVMRVGMLLVGQVVTVLLVAVLANDYGQFYTSWGDIVGTAGGPAAVRNFGVGAAAAPRSGGRPTVLEHASTATWHGLPSGTSGRMRVLGTTDWSTRAQRSTRGAVESIVIDGLGSGLSVPGYVYLPPQYFQPRWSHHRFPAVEALSGYPGSAPALMKRVDYPQLALDAVRRHLSAPMVYVMLSSTVAPPRDTECTDVPHGPQAQTFLAQEVPSAVQAALRVRRDDWGVMGDSTGGYCAAKIAMTHYAVFRGGVSLSGYYFAREDVTTGSLWGGSKALRHLNDPEWMLAHRAAPPASLFVTISKQETRSDGYPDTMRFLHEVRPPMHVTALIEPTGGHNFRTWDRELPTALHWLSARLATG